MNTGRFDIDESTFIEELQCQLTLLTHKDTGARVLHLGNDDPENSFCISFRTYPQTSNGVAHILEHTVLCGSDKYPVSDPFFSMTRRSLNTFMNAFTGPDFTCYPAASQVKQDFYNLFDVYLDAVFHPKIHELSFRQEGWRLEFEEPKDAKTPLLYKGIVYNEMKGALSSPTSRLIEFQNRLLYPDLTYGVNSGGEPKVIPELSYQELIAFHRRYYHPSNALFYLYGDLPLEESLDFIQKNVLDGVKRQPPVDPIPQQKRYTAPKNAQHTYPIAPDESAEGKGIVSVSWMTCPILDQETLLVLQLLEIILMGTDASPLKKALLASGLCTQASSYLDIDVTEVPFVLILKGCEATDGEKLESLILKTIESIISDGIDPSLIESALHQLELHRSEIANEGRPFGITLFLRVGLPMQHGDHPKNALCIHSLFKKVRKHLSDNPRYFEETLQKEVLNNMHRVRINLSPSPTLGAKEEKEEKEKLATLKNNLDEKLKTDLIKGANEFEQFQKEQKQQDLNILPKIALSDISREPCDYLLTHKQCDNTTVFHHDCFTNNMLYATISYPLPILDEADLPYLSLWTTLHNQMGAGERTYAENLDYILAHTGGVGTNLTLHTQSNNFDAFVPAIQLRGKALTRNAEPLFTLLNDMVRTPDFTDRKRLQEVVCKLYISLESTLSSSALKYAIQLSASGLSLAGKLNDDWSGLPFFFLVRDLCHNFDARADTLIEKLQQLQQNLLKGPECHLILSCDASTEKHLEKNHYFGLNTLPKEESPYWIPEGSPPTVSPQGRIIASPIAFSAKVLRAIPYTHPSSAHLAIAARLFHNLTLHTRIREQGGAYIAGSSYNATTGNMALYAGRDPHIASSLAAFEESMQKVLQSDFSEDELEEAKLGVLQSLDAPVPPGSRADVAYTWLCEGRTPILRKQFRASLLDATIGNVRESVAQHLAPQLSQSASIVFAGKELLEREKAILEEKGDRTLEVINSI